MKSNKDSLGDRMKTFYEDRFKVLFPRRSNVLIRLDGKAFHSYTRGLKRPFDEDLAADMNETTKFLCENIQGAKLGYVQSDEISIWVTDYDDIKTSAWFDYSVQKMTSISASMATAKFNELRLKRSLKIMEDSRKPDEVFLNWDKQKLAMFDSRGFTLPTLDEVANYLRWRQMDCTRNSISMAAQSMFSAKQLHGVSSEGKQELLFSKGVNWNDYPSRFKRGGTYIRVTDHFIKKRGEKSKGELVPPDKVLETKQSLGALKDNTPYEMYERSSWKEVETPMPGDNLKMITEIMKPTEG